MQYVEVEMQNSEIKFKMVRRAEWGQLLNKLLDTMALMMEKALAGILK